MLLSQMEGSGLPDAERQCRQPWPGRRFRGDFCFHEQRLVVEVQGGTWAGRNSAHTSGVGFRDDCVKRALALLSGYRVLTVESSQVRDGTALAWIKQLVGEVREDAE